MRNVTPTSMVLAPTDLRWGSNMDSNMPVPFKAVKRSTKGSSSRMEENKLRNLESRRCKSSHIKGIVVVLPKLRSTVGSEKRFRFGGDVTILTIVRHVAIGLLT